MPQARRIMNQRPPACCLPGRAGRAHLLWRGLLPGISADDPGWRSEMTAPLAPGLPA
jgi:hypothetical protein